jgi:hypothetical protein
VSNKLKELLRRKTVAEPTYEQGSNPTGHEIITKLDTKRFPLRSRKYLTDADVKLFLTVNAIVLFEKSFHYL